MQCVYIACALRSARLDCDTKSVSPLHTVVPVLWNNFFKLHDFFIIDEDKTLRIVRVSSTFPL